MNSEEEKIANYYEKIDKRYLDTLCKDINIKNLIKLSTVTNLSIFDKKRKLKKPDTIMKECEKIKRKEIKSSSSALSNLAKLGSNDLMNIKTINHKLENKIEKIDEMLNCVNKINNVKEENDTDKYLAFYSN